MIRQINVKVNPKAKLNKVSEDQEGDITVWTTAAPDKGQANEAVIKLLAEFLKIPKSKIILKRGGTARKKVFEISD